MSDPIDELLEQIYLSGKAKDEIESDRQNRMLNITPSTGRFLDLLIRDSAASRILELGTSNGYSTIWLARAAQFSGGKVDTVDCAAAKHDAAMQNIEQAGLSQRVDFHTADIGWFLDECPAESYDFVFLDSDRLSYVDWFAQLNTVLDYGTLVVDNAISHASEIKPFAELIHCQIELQSVLLPIGKGQLVVRRK